MFKLIKKYLPVIVLIVLSYWSIAPFFTPGFFTMHDDTQVARVFEMHKALADGMFPVRWVSDLGYNYGYPIFNFYAPFAYYIGSIFMLLGFNALIATKIMMALGVLLAGIFMYLLAREFWGEIGGVIAGLLYLYAPYHAVNIYVRGAVAEFWAYAFLPLAFWGLYRVFKSLKSDPNSDTEKTTHRNYKALWLWVSVGAVGYAGIILSHNLTAMMVTPFLIAIAIIYLFLIKAHTKRKRRLFIFLPLVFGILLSAFYWLPTLQEMQYTNVVSLIGGKSDYRLHFVCPLQLWESAWGFGGSGEGCIDGMSFKIGKLHVGFALLSLVSLVFLWKLQKIKFVIVLWSVIFLLFSLLLMIKESTVLWDSISQMAFFQFPWRFLIMVSFITSFLGGASWWLLRRVVDYEFFSRSKMNEYVFLMGGAGIMFAVIFFYSELFVPQTMLSRTVTDYTNPQMLQWTTAKISDEYMPKGFAKPKNFAEVPQEKIDVPSSVRIISLQSKTQEMKATIEAQQQTLVKLHIANFPAWKIYLDNQEIAYKPFNKGLSVEIPTGEHTLTAKFVQTPIEKIGNMLSLTGVIALFLGIIITQRKDLFNARKNKKST